MSTPSGRFSQQPVKRSPSRSGFDDQRPGSRHRLFLPMRPCPTPAVALGRHLFRHTPVGQRDAVVRHVPSDKRSRSPTAGRAYRFDGAAPPVGPMSLVNVAYAPALTWANPSLTRLEDQALVPMYGDHPIELGLEPPTVARPPRGGRPLPASLPGGVWRAASGRPRPRREGDCRVRTFDCLGAIAVRPLPLRPRRRRDLRRRPARRGALLQPAVVVFHLPRRCPLLGRDGHSAAPTAVELHNTGL